LRCRFPRSSLEDVYSKPMKVVKRPGSLKSSEAPEGPEARPEAEQAPVVRRVQVVERLGDGELRELGRGVGRGLGDAEKHRVIGHGIEVERLPELDLEAGRMLDRLTPGVAIGVVGRGERAEREGVEGVRGVHVQVAEERPPIGARRRSTPGERLGLRLEHRSTPEPSHQLAGFGSVVARLLGLVARAAQTGQQQHGPHQTAPKIHRPARLVVGFESHD
jgi:hypothetical protein